ncbi:catechol 2,3-dioxygenase-like lactoylglutathione lyase family enzyme [Rhizomicrobium palustre]|uniref:Catechol 2,3-dioxygenase-like lactoylglutathione lyase family enzyme n=1 Tax=Rhizomicrobium palustre TaxID=189966 RepID=A0A846MUB7_9PROT|nr:VOC family protein [Rhizomicrobium palustre]NIK86946.1 catechol 2,3-dioxygenase-like lactoylglutathione lyase family enzyme [Rhizomicrobium palustre]
MSDQTFPAAAKAMTFIVTSDREAAKTFYGDILGFKEIGEDDYAVVFDLNGIMLRVSTVKQHEAAEHTVLGWEVPDITSAVKTLTDKGVVFNRYPYFEQDELGIWTAPGSTNRVAWFKDPDGNVLSLAQF